MFEIWVHFLRICSVVDEWCVAEITDISLYLISTFFSGRGCPTRLYIPPSSSRVTCCWGTNVSMMGNISDLSEFTPKVHNQAGELLLASMKGYCHCLSSSLLRPHSSIQVTWASSSESPQTTWKPQSGKKEFMPSAAQILLYLLGHDSKCPLWFLIYIMLIVKMLETTLENNFCSCVFYLIITFEHTYKVCV